MENKKIQDDFTQPVIRLRESIPNVPHKKERLILDEDGNEIKRRKIDSLNSATSVNTTNSSSQTLPSSSPVKNVLDLRHAIWGLDPKLVEGFNACGISEMYLWQCECLRRKGVLEGKNIVYTAPTSAGKSLVADILLLRQVLSSGKKALLVLPYVAIITEKVRFLRKLLQFCPEIKIGEFHHGASKRLRFEDVDIAVATIEKTNVILNDIVREGKVEELGVVVLDELHMVGEGGRGATLEIVAAKLRSIGQDSIQIIGMSATLGNSAHLASWLDAQHYASHFRPIALQEYHVHDNVIYNKDDTVKIKIPRSDKRELKSNMTNDIIALALETVMSGHAVLVFCQSRHATENYAKLISKIMPVPSPDLLQARQATVSQLFATPTGLDSQLASAIERGVGYHHAGLTTEERDIVSTAYDQGLLKVICCTATMAAGVNLPARRVIMQPRMGRDLLSPIMLSQMRGRAGRKGKDTVGESFLVCEGKELEAIRKLKEMEMPCVESMLDNKGTREEGSTDGITRALLEIISTNLAASEYDIEDFLKFTLLYHSNPSDSNLQSLINTSLESLKSLGLIEDDPDISETYRATALGHATVTSGLDPHDSVFLHSELQNSMKSFNLTSELQICYNLTPITLALIPINWPILRTEFEKLSDSESQIAISSLGIDPYFINKMAQGGIFKEDTPAAVTKIRTYRRFWYALMLRELIEGSRLDKIADRFEVLRGTVQILSSTCRGFATTSVGFCRGMGRDWAPMAVLLEHYSQRLDLGVTPDLMDLAKLPFVKSYTACIFFQAGFKSISQVASTAPQKLLPVLLEACPSKVKGRHEGTALRDMLLKRAEIIVNSAIRLNEREQFIDELDID